MEVKPEVQPFAKIKVVGVGGSGGAAINRMVASKIKGVEFMAINTDAQALHNSRAPQKIHIGMQTTRGLGAGMDPDLGRKAAEENRDEIKDALKGSDMVFLTCGLGGGTGTGATPLIANLAREAGALTIAVVTKPFVFEGAQRRAVAERGLDDLVDSVDSIIVIPNDRLLQLIDKKTSLLEAFAVCDEVLRQGVQGISELVTVPGLINVDFADVKAIMSGTGTALMGIGVGSGENRAVDAARAAVESPLLEIGIDGARGVLFTVTGGPDLTLQETHEAAKVITASVDPNAKIIFGTVIDDTMKDQIKVTVIATGFGQAGRKILNLSSNISSQAPKLEKVPPSQPSNVRENTEPIFHERPIMSKPAPQPITINTEMPMRPAPAKQVNSSRNVPPQNDDEYEIPSFIKRKLKS
ncbi:MAG: cell division protein FtsZ [Patescibacteria group bacterium]